MMRRECLPGRRESELHQLHDGVLDYAVGVSRYMDDRPAEVFIASNKPASAGDDIARDAAVVISIALQFGVPVEVMAGAITRLEKGEPASVIGLVLDVLNAPEPPRASEMAALPTPRNCGGDGSCEPVWGHA